MSEIKMCIFDLDGTLIDSLEDLAISVNYALEKNGFATHSTDAYRQFVGDGAVMLIKRAMATKEFTQREFDKVKKDYDEHYKMHCIDKTALYDGALELLNELKAKDIKLAIISNKPDDFVKSIMIKMNLTQYFDYIAGGLPDVPKKPDPYAFNVLLQKFSLTQNECLYVGDSNVDIFTGKNAGIKTLGASWGFRGKQELLDADAEVIIDNLSEVLSYVK